MMGRGLAFDQCRLTNHETHQEWLQALLNNITKDVPAGYMQRSALSKHSEEIRRCSLRASPTRELPMDQKMKALMFDPRVAMHLLPLPKGSAKSSDASATSIDRTDPGLPLRNPKPKKKAKASPKAKAKCPEELKSYSQFDSNNQPICWPFNLAGCKEAVQNGRCKKGAHICIKCHRANHGLASCRVSKN